MELTIIDVVRFQKRSGHLNNIASVLEELFSDIDLEKLDTICQKRTTPTAVLQRLGYIFERIIGENETTELILNILNYN